ncbi:ASTE1 protein, partial [Furnarius figulus]|nr:ASTE1 protein [Furnarius figulus]
RRCALRAVVVLDGGRGARDRKLRTLRGRAAEQLRAAQGLARPGGGDGDGEGDRHGDGGGRGLAPLLARDAFVQALRRLGVPFVQCFGEADREIAALANSWGCPVLSLDSDFCVFDLAGGYCPLPHFHWESAGRFVPARCFSADRFCAHFGPLRKGMLPLFAVLSGNDFVGPAALERLFSKARLPAGGPGRHRRLQGILRWLSQFAEPAEALENVLQHLEEHQREEAREILCTSMQDYAPSDVSLEGFFESGRYECEEGREAEVPRWVLDALARAELAPFIINTLLLRSVFLRVQVENMRRASAHSAALPIRQVIYGLLLPGAPRSTLHASPGHRLPVVCEFDRCQKTVKKTFVQAASLPTDFCDDRFSLDKLVEVPMSCRQKLLLETLGVKMSFLESVPSHLQLPAAVTCYWLRCSEPKVKLHQLKALLLMIVSGELHRINDEPDPMVSCAEEDSMAYNEFLKWKEKKLQNNDFDLDAAHSFCQWQCCLQMGLYLNQLLCTPLPEPDISRLYTGTLVHRLCQELKSTPSVENLFILSPKMTQLYLLLLKTVES